jgi:hypothetical protein
MRDAGSSSSLSREEKEKDFNARCEIFILDYCRGDLSREEKEKDFKARCEIFFLDYRRGETVQVLGSMQTIILIRIKRLFVDTSELEVVEEPVCRKLRDEREFRCLVLRLILPYWRRGHVHSSFLQAQNRELASSLTKSEESESESEMITNASSRIARSCCRLLVTLLSDCVGKGAGGGDEPPAPVSAKIVVQLRNVSFGLLGVVVLLLAFIVNVGDALGRRCWS